MKRVLASPYDTLATWGMAGLVAGAIYVTGYAIGKTTAMHAARETRERLCEQRSDAMAKARGYTVVRLAMPCSEPSR